MHVYCWSAEYRVLRHCPSLHRLCTFSESFQTPHSLILVISQSPSMAESQHITNWRFHMQTVQRSVSNWPSIICSCPERIFLPNYFRPSPIDHDRNIYFSWNMVNNSMMLLFGQLTIKDRSMSRSILRGMSSCCPKIYINRDITI